MKKEKNNLGYIILVGFLCLVLGILGGYILFKNDNGSNGNIDNTSTNSTVINSNYSEWMNYILKQNITSITLSRSEINPDAGETNNTKVYLTVEQLKNIFSKYNGYDLVKEYFQGKGSPRDILVISYSINGVNYDVKIEDAFISSDIKDTAFTTILESSKTGDGEFIDGASYAYVLQNYDRSIFDTYFK